jgi:low temperature requirement protein LtrA
MTIVTGLLALVIGFGLWWIYFDIVGRRLPRTSRGSIAAWMLSHLPITLSITAAGAAIVSLVEHAHDPITPAATAWLLSGSVALGLLALVLTSNALEDAVRLASVYRPLTVAFAVGAVVAVLAGWVAATSSEIPSIKAIPHHLRSKTRRSAKSHGAGERRPPPRALEIMYNPRYT